MWSIQLQAARFPSKQQSSLEQEMATKGGGDIEVAPIEAGGTGNNISDDIGGHGVTGGILAFFSFCLVVLFFPFSMFSTIKVRPRGWY